MAELSDRGEPSPQSSGSKDRRHAVVPRGSILIFRHPILTPPHRTDLRHFTDLCSTDRTMDTIRDIIVDVKGYTILYNLVYIYMYTKLYREMDKEMDVEMDTKMDGIAYK